VAESRLPALLSFLPLPGRMKPSANFPYLSTVWTHQRSKQLPLVRSLDFPLIRLLPQEERLKNVNTLGLQSHTIVFISFPKRSIYDPTLFCGPSGHFPRPLSPNLLNFPKKSFTICPKFSFLSLLYRKKGIYILWVCGKSHFCVFFSYTVIFFPFC
jgi:hypothetical protein